MLFHGAREKPEAIAGIVTHVLEGEEADPIKLDEIREIEEIPVVGYHWVINCVKAGAILPIYPQIFSGLVASSTGIGLDDVKKLWAALSLHGGSFMPLLHLDRCNVLICGKASGVISEIYDYIHFSFYNFFSFLCYFFSFYKISYKTYL